MKKILCLVLSLLLVLSMAACKKSDTNTPTGDPTTATTAPTEDPASPVKQDLKNAGPWVVTAEYEKGTDTVRNYRYDKDGNLLGFGDYTAKYEANDQGGETMILVPYTADGKESTMFSKLHYVYDADGKLTGFKRYEALGNKLADSITFEYDADGNLVKQEKHYMENWHETITYSYQDGRVIKATFKNSVNEVSYKFIYDDAGIPSQVDFHNTYVKSGNVVEGSVVLLKSEYVDDTTYRLNLSAGSTSTGVSTGKEVIRYEVKYDENGKPLNVTLEIKEWGVFQNGFVPMRLCGAMNSVNLSAGCAKFVYKPLADCASK